VQGGTRTRGVKWRHVKPLQSPLCDPHVVLPEYFENSTCWLSTNCSASELRQRGIPCENRTRISRLRIERPNR
jgi:hypothetical protein